MRHWIATDLSIAAWISLDHDFDIGKAVCTMLICITRILSSKIMNVYDHLLSYDIKHHKMTSILPENLSACRTLNSL